MHLCSGLKIDPEVSGLIESILNSNKTLESLDLEGMYLLIFLIHLKRKTINSEVLCKSLENGLTNSTLQKCLIELE